jgi:hypothetical protein
MKTAGRENPNSRTRMCNEPNTWGGRSEASSLIHRDWKVRKAPAQGEVFFLTFSFIELLGTWLFDSSHKRNGSSKLEVKDLGHPDSALFQNCQ